MIRNIGIIKRKGILRFSEEAISDGIDIWAAAFSQFGIFPVNIVTTEFSTKTYFCYSLNFEENEEGEPIRKYEIKVTRTGEDYTFELSKYA